LKQADLAYPTEWGKSRLGRGNVMTHDFEHETLNDVYAKIAEIEEAEKKVRALKDDLNELTRELAVKTGTNKELREQIVNYLYWHEEYINKTVLKDAFNATTFTWAKKTEDRIFIGKLEVEILCCICKKLEIVELSSQSRLVSFLNPIYDNSHTCDKCNKAIRENNNRYREERKIQEELRIEALRTMPYREYLETDEWKARRKRAMRKAGFRCQVCNRYGVRLNTHHRTYERRGQEYDSDLIVLCQDCHYLFHQNGSLAGGEA
jgi:hypothetical protein